MKINITCGQNTNDYYSEKYSDEIFVPFNEAMIYGDLKEEIFGKEFILERIKTHKTTYEEYMSKMQAFLALTEKINEYEITCWFGDDDFCKINLLVLFAYLDQIKYKKEIIFNLIDERTYEIKKTRKVSVNNYKQKYLNEIVLKNN